MPPALLLNFDEIDLNKIAYDVDAIEKVNPHRFEMRQLDAIVYFNAEKNVILGYKDLTENEFWVRGHIPGRPLMPGVLMVEAAAQLASFFAKLVSGEDRFLGFGGIEDVKFRGQVSPGQRLYLLGKFLEKRPRRFKMAAQGVSDNQLVFEGTVIGMPM